MTAVTPETDERLMRRVQNDEADAFERLYDRHCGRAFRVAFAVCRDSTRAEDAVQEGFFAIWQSRGSYASTSGSVCGWAMTIVWRRAVDSNRRESARPNRAEHPRELSDAAVTSPPDATVAQEDAEALMASLSRLPCAQAEVIALAFFGQLSHTEIARVLSLPPGTVKGRMRLGLHKLRDDLQKEDALPPAARRAGP